MTAQPIPFNRPHLTGGEMDNLRAVLTSEGIASDGAFSERCLALLSERLGGGAVFLTPSGTDALEFAVRLAEIEPGDEVIMPSFAFSSTANAVILAGGIPVFVDVAPDTLNLDPQRVAEAVTERTRALIPIHYAGVACDMEALTSLAAAHELTLIEDGAQALGSSYQGRPLGTLGEMGIFSFHYTKNVIGGEGGALCINDERLVARAHILRDKGSNRRQFIDGEVRKYHWLDLGSSYVIAEPVAAIIAAQLAAMDDINACRMALWRRYEDELAGLEREGKVRLSRTPEGTEHNAHIFYLLLNDENERTRFIAHMRAAGIQTTFHFVPLHSSPGGQRFGRAVGGMEVTDSSALRLVRLPLYPDLTREEQQRVIAATCDFFGSRASND